MSARPAHARVVAGDEGRDFVFTPHDFARVRTLIHRRAGIALSDGKQDMVYSRLARQLRAGGFEAFKSYLDHLESRGSADDWQAFTNALTTNLTSFFREAHHFDLLAKHLSMPRSHGRLTIWCAAASTGEEPYSLAMTACEAFGSARPPVTILATDIDTQVLETAARGIYPLERIESLSAERRRRFFLKGAGSAAGQCRVVDSLQALIQFRPLNLLDARYPMRGPFDAIFCRNVMIYFDKPTQYAILQRMSPLLAADGLFFAGHSESFFHAAELIEACGRTVYRRPAAAKAGP
jgi:chemotaxis protein methyltransferase CheR